MPVQIRFSDVDQFGHMNNSVYFSLYDLAKTTYIKDVLGSADWSKLAIVVANINANFFMPVFFSDHLVIETAVVHLGHKSFTLLQRAVTTDTHEVKCECRSRQRRACRAENRHEHSLTFCANSGVSLPRRKRFCAGNGWDFKISVDFLKNCVKRITDPLAEL